jgi:hypothetical protein
LAGTRQHFIPRYLLRRFANGHGQVRVLRRDGQQFVTSITNIGVENEFFGPPGSGSADEAITVEESRVLALLNVINDHPQGPVQNHLAAQVIVHLTVRARSLRTFMVEAGTKAIDGINRRFTDPATLRSMMRDYLKANPTFLLDELHNEIRRRYGENAVEMAQKHPVYPVLTNMLSDLAFRQLEDIDGLPPQFANAFLQLRDRLGEAVQGVHKKVALSDPTPEKRVAALSIFSFAVCDSNSDLVLGDSVAWGQRLSVGITPLYTLEDDLQVIVLPISSSKYVLGWKDERPQVSDDAIILGSVETSEDFALSYPSSDNLTRFSGVLGQARAMTLAALEAEIRNF